MISYATTWNRVLAWRHVGVVRHAALPGGRPVALEPFHPVSEAEPLRRRQAQRRVLNLELAFTGGSSSAAGKGTARPSAMACSMTTGRRLGRSGTLGTISTAPFVLGSQTSPVVVTTPAGWTPPLIWFVFRPSVVS